MIIKEEVQVVCASRETPLPMTIINKALLKAYSNRMYAKFIIDNNLFIQVNFMKDNTVNVSTNMTLPGLIADLQKKSRYGWTFALAKQFVYQWISLSRRIVR